MALSQHAEHGNCALESLRVSDTKCCHANDGNDSGLGNASELTLSCKSSLSAAFPGKQAGGSKAVAPAIDIPVGRVCTRNNEQLQSQRLSSTPNLKFACCEASWHGFVCPNRVTCVEVTPRTAVSKRRWPPQAGWRLHNT